MIISFKDYRNEATLREALEYHKENKIPITKSIFRMYSENFFRLFETVREAYKNNEYSPVTEMEEEFLNTDIGKFELYEGKEVPLDMPLLEKEDVELNKPRRGGPKKYYVYVKNDKGNVVKVTWGDTTGLKVKINDPDARKSFAARHKCSEQNDKTTPAYWACRLPRYGRELGLKVDNPDTFW